jgi:hypothetical protein
MGVTMKKTMQQQLPNGSEIMPRLVFIELGVISVRLSCVLIPQLHGYYPVGLHATTVANIADSSNKKRHLYDNVWQTVTTNNISIYQYVTRNVSMQDKGYTTYNYTTIQHSPKMDTLFDGSGWNRRTTSA